SHRRPLHGCARLRRAGGRDGRRRRARRWREDRPAAFAVTATKGEVTAAVLVIGNEILSGRTKDVNLGFLAEQLTALGIRLREARVIADLEADIVATVNETRARYDYVFTTGGIGPTHDDITAACVAKAFGVALVLDQRAVAV